MNLDNPSAKLRCLAVAIAGVNGKSTTAGLIERMLIHNHRRTLVCGPEPESIAAGLEQSGDLDYLIVQLDPGQLECAEWLRPSTAVLLNLPPRPESAGEAVGPDTLSHLFKNQQFFDWAVVQAEALERLHQEGISIPSKLISFSSSGKADLYVDHGLLVSGLENWPGPLLDLEHCLLRGPHNAENLLAALAVGHVLRLPLDAMVDALKTFQTGSHRCEMVAEINGVQFIDDSKASNIAALVCALRTARPGDNGEPNVWLIAGGDDDSQDFHAVGPLISKRVKGAFLVGKASQKIRLAWSLFTPCMSAASLLEAVAEAAKSATSGDVVLLSPACSGLDQFRNYQYRGQVFCEAVKSIGRGQVARRPHMLGVPAPL